MVRMIVGEDENGTQIVCEAGEPSGRVLEVTNPWGTQQMASDMLAKIQGYQYKPFTADGALLDPAAELGDSVTVGNVYSVINSAETTFSPLMSSTISAREDSTLDHEYPYELKENREIERRIGGVKASLIVAVDKIEGTITDLDNNLSSQITQTVNSITAEVERATAAEGNLSSRITINAESITSEVERATGVEGNLSSQITQTASEIRAEVNGIYADEWESGTGAGTSYYYNPGDIVKVTNRNAVIYYKCIDANDSNGSNKPGSGAYWRQYWEVTTPSSVQSMIDLGLDGITIGYQESDLNNSAIITLNKAGIQLQAQTITMTNVVADTLKANSSITSPIIYSADESTWMQLGTLNNHYGLELRDGVSVGNRIFGVYDGDFGYTSFNAKGFNFMTIDSPGTLGVNGNVYCRGTWDFSSATKVIMPDGTVFE